MPRRKPTKICDECDDEFQPRSGKPNQHFCTQECYWQARRTQCPQTFVCGNCHESFERIGSRIRYFCSIECRFESQRKTAKASFAQFVVKGIGPDDCYDWTGFIDPNGRAMFHFNGTKCSAARAAWIMAKGPIPDGLFVCHRCDNGRCSRLDHLFLGTHQENMDDAVAKRRMPRGDNNRLSKLSEADVRMIQTSAATQRVLAESFGVSQSLISLIRSHRRRKHLT